MRLIDADALEKYMTDIMPENTYSAYGKGVHEILTHLINFIRKEMPTIESEPIQHGRWIECDYKSLEHGMIETYQKAGLCCSVCRAGFKKSNLTYKQHCAACGAKMDGGADNGNG